MAKAVKKVKEERLEDILFSYRNHPRRKADMHDRRDVLLTLLYTEGYPPDWDDEVFRRVLEQMENYKRRGGSPEATHK